MTSLKHDYTYVCVRFLYTSYCIYIHQVIMSFPPPSTHRMLTIFRRSSAIVLIELICSSLTSYQVSFHCAHTYSAARVLVQLCVLPEAIIMPRGVAARGIR